MLPKNFVHLVKYALYLTNWKNVQNMQTYSQIYLVTTEMYETNYLNNYLCIVKTINLFLNF